MSKETVTAPKPLVLTFDPSTTESLFLVWQDDLARKFWLIYRPRYLVDQHFPMDCLRIAKAWRMKEPQTVDEFLRFCLERTSFGGAYPFKALREVAEYAFPKMLENEPTWKIKHEAA